MTQNSAPLWQAGSTNGLPHELSATPGMSFGQMSPSLQSPYKTINMDTESVLSGYSERSKKGRSGTAAYASLLSTSGSSAMNATPVLMGPNIATLAGSGTPLGGSPYQIAALQGNNSGQMDNSLSARAVSTLSRQQLTKSGGDTRNLYDPPLKVESPYNISNRHELIEVRNFDDNWGENTTAITGNTSDQSGSLEDLNRSIKEYPRNSNLQLQCQMWAGSVIAIVLSACAFLSPIIMVILPKLDMFEWKTKECGPECDGLLISFVFKMFILLVGSWALFFRRPKATMPRVCVYRAAVLTLLVIFMVAYWLFYSVRIAEKRFNEEDAVSYHSVILFAISLVDALLFIHYLAVILLEIRHIEAQYFVKVVRSPDGYSQCYNLGTISIQRASVWILEKYYQDFPIFNPHLERVPSRRGRRMSVSGRHENAALKYYDVDEPRQREGGSKATSSGNLTINPLQLSPKSILAQNTAANAGTKNGRPYMNGGSTTGEGRTNRRDRDTASHVSGHSGHHRHHSDRFYDEHDYERRVRKRKSRLISVTEEAFTHIKRVQQNRTGPSVPMDPKEAAQAIFPSIAKTLQKFLRITRQQPRHTIQSILTHLTTCLSFDLSPKTFLEKYLNGSAVLTNDEERKPIQTWNLICDTLLSRSIESGTMFLLRQGDISLLVTVHTLPHFNIAEQVIDPKTNKFVFRLNSETSV